VSIAAVVVGDVMTDILARLAGPVRRGTDQQAEIVTLPGGGGANQATWLAACGVRVGLAARVAAADRDAIAAALAAAGVTPHLAADAQAPTGALICLVEPDGERSFLSSRGANARLAPDDLPESLLEGAGLLHVSGYALLEPGSRAAATRLMAVARERGLVVSVDPGSAGFLADLGPSVFLGAVCDADVIFPNRDEAERLTGEHATEAQLDALLRHVPMVVLKQGSAGAIAATRQGERITRPAVAARVVDTTGAGDAFFAGFMANWLGARDLGAALEAGNRVAAMAVARLGAQPQNNGR